MAARKDVYNITRECWLKRRQAEKAVSECAAEWVDGDTIRLLTVQEAYVARQVLAQRREDLAGPLPYAEIPGIRFAPAVTGIPAKRREGVLLWQAHQFVAAHQAAA